MSAERVALVCSHRYTDEHEKATITDLNLGFDEDLGVVDVRLKPFRYEPPRANEARGQSPPPIQKEKMWYWEDDGCTI